MTAKPYSQACVNNQAAIFSVIKDYLSQATRVLEIGSGTGQHAVYFAQRLPHCNWQCSDLMENLPGIQAWINESGLANLPQPVVLEAEGSWPQESFDAVFTANSLHIMSLDSVQTLFHRASSVLASDARLLIYGPFRYGGNFTSVSNRQFQLWLKARNADSGIRDIEDLLDFAMPFGLHLETDHAMPANNRLLVWKKQA